jgi:hypothetical protein
LWLSNLEEFNVEDGHDLAFDQRAVAAQASKKRKRFLGFHQQQIVKGSVRQFVQLRSTRRKVTTTEKSVPVFNVKLTPP